MSAVERTAWETWIDRMVLVLFGIIAIIGTASHEPWLDEAQHWCLARDSATPADLWRNTSGEGHPMLWYLVLWTLTRFTDDPRAMAGCHMLIAVAAMGLLVLRSPLPRVLRWMLPFGYFLLFEYTVIARNYALCVLLLFLAIMLDRKERAAWKLVALILLCHVHLFGAIMALAYQAATTFTGRRGREVWAASMILALFAVPVLWRAIPTPGSPFGIASRATLGPGHAINVIAQYGQAAWPWVPMDNAHPWNVHVLADYKPVLAIAGAASLIAAFLLLPRSSRARWFFVLAATGILLFPLLTGFKGMRYYGSVLVAWIAAQWIGRIDSGSRRIHWIIIPWLLVQIIGAISMLVLDHRRDFSAGARIVEALKKNGHERGLIIETRYTAGPTISALLGRPLWYARTRASGSWCDWNNARAVDPAEEMAAAIGQVGGGAVMLTREPMRPEDHPGLILRPIIRVEDGMIDHENGCATFVERSP